MKTHINTTGEHVCNAVTEFFKANETNMDDIIFIWIDGVTSMIGRRKGFVYILNGDRRVFTNHCVLHR